MPINITHDGPLDLATGRSRHEVNWKNKSSTWGALLTKLSVTQRTHETYAEYLASKKPRQDELKDVGGFIGGYLSGGRRGKGSVNYRQLVTLDVDFAPPGIWGDLTLMYDCAGAVYSTHKHGPDKPRLRLIIPLDRHVLCDEYTAIARRIAGVLGIEYFDDTTYQPERLMYWPSTSKDGDYIFEYQDGPWLCADEMLATYRDWTDSSEWPVSDREGAVIQRAIKKQGDPLEKHGVVGAFCRTFTIHDAISTYLSDVYTPCDVEDRYSYAEGTTSAGLVTYDDKYAYSHHGTDPISMKLCNAFDLVRIHLYGLKDEDSRADTPNNKKPSYLAMVNFAANIDRVKIAMQAERQESAEYDFRNIDNDEPDTDLLSNDVEEINTDWVAKLKANSKNEYLPSLVNVVTILENDQRLRGIKLDEHSQRELKSRPLPWDDRKKYKQYLTDTDTANLTHYLQVFYGIAPTKQVIENAIKVVLHKNRCHVIREYLTGLTWDGQSRVDDLLIDYLGAEPSDYIRAITRKTLVAAVTRVFEPGCKFDYMLILVGKQGTYKSTFISKLGMQWFSDRFHLGMIQTKEGAEQIQGVWIMEVGELSGMKKAEIESVKSFVSAPTDRFRVPFSTKADDFPRQCIFIGTTNDDTFLRDPTGNRRFWVAQLGVHTPLFDVHAITEADVHQVWAEAMHLYKKGETRYLSAELEAVAELTQAEHTQTDPRVGIIADALDVMLPDNWNELNIYERRVWLKGDALQAAGTVERTQICAAEICCEILDWQRKDINVSNTKEIHQIMRNIPGWGPKNGLSYGEYGKQRGYVRLNPKAVQQRSSASTITIDKLHKN